MPHRRYDNQSPRQHTQRQISELGQAVRKAARQVDRSYPNAQQGDRIVRDFQQQTNRIVQSGRQHRNRSLTGSSYQTTRSAGSPFGVFLFWLLLVVGIGFLGFLGMSLSWSAVWDAMRFALP